MIEDLFPFIKNIKFIFAVILIGIIILIVVFSTKKKGGYHGSVDLPFNDSIINTNSELTYDTSTEFYPFNNFQGRVR